MRHHKIRRDIVNNEQIYATSTWWKREMYDKQFDQSPFGVYGSNKYNVQGLEDMQKLSHKYWRPAENPTSKELGSCIGDVCPIPDPSNWSYSQPLDQKCSYHILDKKQFKAKMAIQRNIKYELF